MNQEQLPDNRTSFRNFVGIVVLVARSMAVSVEVFLHEPDSFGERYLGLPATAALFMIFFWPVLCEPRHDPRPTLVFLVIFVAMCLAVKARLAIRRKRNTPQPHSRYNGTPRLLRVIRRLEEAKLKCMAEPLLTFGLGSAILAVSPPLGGYLMCCAPALIISNGLMEVYERERARNMHDAYLQQRRIVERFHDLRRD